MSFPALFLFGCWAVLSAAAFDVSRSDNIAMYWGQNSYGATPGAVASEWQQTLSFYCGDNSPDVIPLSFLDTFFSTGGLPSLNLANVCSASGTTFANTQLPNCAGLANDIKKCQAAGKAIVLSLGGATAQATFSSDAQAKAFADTIWNLFLGGSSATRPFGNAVLDGVDLDIESGGPTGFAAFVTQLRTHFVGADKQYYVTAAPQCPFPDMNLGTVLDSAHFDMVFVQFYNNYCGLQAYNDNKDWNFDTWHNWAVKTSPNKAVKIFIGAPASASAAGQGYVNAGTLAKIAKSMQSQYSSFGGVMFWDASQAWANGRIDQTVKDALSGGAAPPANPTPTATGTTSSTTGTPNPTTGPGGACATLSAWSSSATYVHGDSVSYENKAWTAKWWTNGDTPGGSADVWTNDGACVPSRKMKRTFKDVPEEPTAPIASPPTVAPSPSPVVDSPPEEPILTPTVPAPPHMLLDQEGRRSRIWRHRRIGAHAS